MHVHGCVIFFVKLKGHVHVLVQVPKGFTLIVLQPQANRPVLLSLQKKTKRFVQTYGLAADYYVSTLRDPVGGAVLPCVSARLGFSVQRECLCVCVCQSDLPYFTSFSFFF